RHRPRGVLRGGERSVLHVAVAAAPRLSGALRAVPRLLPAGSPLRAPALIRGARLDPRRLEAPAATLSKTCLAPARPAPRIASHKRRDTVAPVASICGKTPWMSGTGRSPLPSLPGPGRPTGGSSVPAVRFFIPQAPGRRA